MNTIDNKTLFEKVIEQQNVIDILNTLSKIDVIPHALLFSGIKGSGKVICSKLFAMVSNCAKGIIDLAKANYSCECKSCKKIRSKSHPDIIEIIPSDSIIKIAEIRKLCDTLSLKPLEAKLRFVLIYDSDKMNKEAGNALLKMLEEPPKNTSIILTASNVSELLSTIVSRCRHIKFAPISNRSIKKFLLNKYDIPQEHAEIIAEAAEGSLSYASLFKDETWMKHRNWLLNEIESVASKSVMNSLLLAEKISMNKDMLQHSLKIIKNWLRDILVYQFSPGKIKNKDITDKIKMLSKKYNKNDLYSPIYLIESLEKKLSSGINIRLAIETIMFKIGTYV